MLITSPMHLTDEILRRYYVGITRAKQRLFIHTNGQLFDQRIADRYFVDTQQYEMPEEIVLQLSHKDVNLGFFKPRKREILALRAGERLRFESNYLYDIHTGSPICQLSQKMQTELTAWENRNYYVSDAAIRFVVAWRPKDAPKDEGEYAVLLVDLTLQKPPGNGMDADL